MNEPWVTVGVAARNEAATIRKCIESLLGEMADLDSELVVVAGGEDGTAEEARHAISGCERCTLIEETDPKGKPAALNLISSRARGQILFLTDGDVIIKEGSVRSLLGLFGDETVGAATGRVVGKQRRFNLIESVCDYTAGVMNSSRAREYSTKGTVVLASGYIIAIRKSLMPLLPEEVISDDGYISAHVRSNGLKIAYSNDAEALIVFPDNLSDFLKQKSRTRFGHIQVAAMFPSMAPRRLGDDVRQRLSMHREANSPGPAVAFASSVLVGLSWLIAYLRYKMPPSLAGNVWVRVDSTKRL